MQSIVIILEKVSKCLINFKVTTHSLYNYAVDTKQATSVFVSISENSVNSGELNILYACPT